MSSTECWTRTSWENLSCLCSPTSRICPTPWVLRRWRTSWVCTAFATDNGTSRLVAPPPATVCTRVWIGFLLPCRRESKRTDVKYYEATAYTSVTLTAGPRSDNKRSLFVKQVWSLLLWSELVLCCLFFCTNNYILVAVVSLPLHILFLNIHVFLLLSLEGVFASVVRLVLFSCTILNTL